MIAEPNLQALLDKQLAHAQTLLREVTRPIGNWKENGGRAFETVTDVLIQAIFARSTRTYAAVVGHLGDRGFAEQGAMLNRSLFEDMVDARWVSFNPELAIERLRQHDRYSQALRLDVAARFPEYLGNVLPELDPPMSDEERKKLRDLFGTYGDGSWTGISLYERFKAIEGSWDQGLARRQADFMRAWMHRLNNETLHLSAYSLGRLGSPKNIENELHFNLGSTEDYLLDVLWCAFWTYLQTVWLLWDTFGLRGKDEIDEDVAQPAFAAFNEALLARA